MSRLFANGTEGDAWMTVWCNECANDADGTCPIVNRLLFEPDEVPPEIIEQPDGEYHLPPLHLCTAYTPGADGDPHAERRANVIAYVTERRART